MISLIDLVKTLITESYFLDKIKTSNGNVVTIEYTNHSIIGNSVSSESGRVQLEGIFDSIKNFIDVIHSNAIIVLQNCKDKECSLIVRDYLYGIDYHLWVNLNAKGELLLIINTSIAHPKKLLNKQKTRIININTDDSYNILEYKNNR